MKENRKLFLCLNSSELTPKLRYILSTKDSVKALCRFDIFVELREENVFGTVSSAIFCYSIIY